MQVALHPMRHNPNATLLMTRPRPEAESFVAELANAGMTPEVCFSPLLSIAPTGNPVTLCNHDAVIFTSQHAVAFVPNGQGQPAFCVGDTTAVHAKAMGFEAISANGAADQLIKLISTTQIGKNLLHIRGAHTRGQVAQRLTALGFQCSEVIVYDQCESALTSEARALLSGGNPVILPLFSPRTAEILGKQVHLQKNHHVIAMSENVARGLNQDGGQDGGNVCSVVREPTIPAMIDATRLALAT